MRERLSILFTVPMASVQRHGFYLHLARLCTMRMLAERTRATPARRWRWACRAHPGAFTRALRAEMRALVEDIAAGPMARLGR